MGNNFAFTSDLANDQDSAYKVPGNILLSDAARDINITGDATFNTGKAPPHNRVGYGEVNNLKLEAQKIRDFTGVNQDWAKWKNRIECAFDGSGFDRILVDEEFSTSKPRMNKIVYFFSFQ